MGRGGSWLQATPNDLALDLSAKESRWPWDRWLRDANDAFLAKLGWRLATKDGHLWVNVWKAKYHIRASVKFTYVARQ